MTTREERRARAFQAMKITISEPAGVIPRVYKLVSAVGDWCTMSPDTSWSAQRSRFDVGCQCNHPVCQSTLAWNAWANSVNYRDDMPEIVEWEWVP